MSVVIGAAGHVDHGKTTLIQALTGHDPRRHPEERARGMTIDIGFAPLRVPGPGGRERTLGVIDVPGHARFLKNMLAGITGAEIALLVIACDDGPMPQTLEHLEILDLLGVRHGVCVLSKTDLVPGERLEQVRAQAGALLGRTSLAGIPMLPFAAPGAHGIDAIRRELIAQADAAEPDPAASPGLFRLFVDRVFSKHGHGTVVTGTASSGRVAVGDLVLLQPGAQPHRVRGLQRFGEPTEHAGAGERLALNLRALAARGSEIERGQILCAPEIDHSSRRILLAFRVLHAPARARSNGDRLPRQLPVTAHIGSGHLPAVAVFRSETPVPEGPEVLCELLLPQPVSLLRGDAVIARLDGEGLTLGSGRVLHPAPPARCPLPPLAALRSPEPAALLATLLALEPSQALALPRAAALLNRPVDEVSALLEGCAELTALVAQGQPHVVHAGSASALRRELFALLDRLHAEQRDQSGWSRDDLRSRLRCHRSLLFDWVVDAALAAGELTSEGSLLKRPQHSVRHDPATERAIDALEKLYAKQGLAPPSIAELPGLVGAPAPLVRKAFDELVKRDRLVRVSREFYFECAAHARFVDAVCTRTPASGLTIQHLRDWFGLSRRHLIPLLEHLDARGITRRVGDVRHVRRASPPR